MKTSQSPPVAHSHHMSESDKVLFGRAQMCTAAINDDNTLGLHGAGAMDQSPLGH